jgi:hypothetical protein
MERKYGKMQIRFNVDEFDLEEGRYAPLEYFIDKEGTLDITIDLNTHSIIGWENNENKSKYNLFEKVRDEGTYVLYNTDGTEAAKIEGYVPNKAIPDEKGYGDYVEFDIGEDGVIKNWYKNPDFSEFFE